MKIAMNIFSFELFFKKPLNTSAGIIRKKDGFLLKISDGSGISGMGEVSILPGFTERSPAEIAAQLKRLKNVFTGSHLRTVRENGVFGTTDILNGEKLFPPVNFALDSAILNYLGNKNGLSCQEILRTGLKEKRSVSINALLMISENIGETLNEAVSLKSSGFKKIKIKIGRLDSCYEKKVLNSLFPMFGGEKIFRLDANCMFDHTGALDFFRGIDTAAIEYIEDPFPELEMIPEFYSETGVPVAPDSLLHKIDLLNPADIPWLGALIIKPPVLGGIDKISGIYRAALRLNVPMVFTSLFESGIGIANIAKISSAFDRLDTAMGLDTLKFFREDLLQGHPGFSGGNYIFEEQKKYEDTLNMEMLREI